jgi:hypothetical protein
MSPAHAPEQHPLRSVTFVETTPHSATAMASRTADSDTDHEEVLASDVEISLRECGFVHIISNWDM